MDQSQQLAVGVEVVGGERRRGTLKIRTFTEPTTGMYL